jgi:hypothetical protein
MRWVMYRRPLAGVFEFGLSGTGFNLSSCVHRVRDRAEAKIVGIAA